ncbi:M1 family metallopeptidase [Massilia horti]|uniref:Aminopeptidase n=1 Tax=Massilia horti TaxID=2562153 RepID=A0A4Y9T4B3_9BURK|nr:M1 family metallopeptidase [Massilia horti]TFW34844.1 M1 family peptidase [Massilia horti]
MRRSLSYAALLLLLPLLGAAQPTTAPAPAPRAPITTQLPRGVIPDHYDISITPNAKALTFAAKATIALTVQQPTRSITLNATDLKFLGARLTPFAGGAAVTPTITVNPAAQTATFMFDRPLASGRYTLALDYTGVIGTQAVGLFALDYDTPKGKQRALFTQFENSDARRVIPCWDEPAYKATFALEAVVPTGLMAVGNMPIAHSEKLRGGLTRVQFAQTPRMSTYLLFFGLGDLERAHLEAEGTDLGVVTRKGVSNQGQFALDSAKALLPEYNDYFGVPYPLPKLDNVAGPGRSQFFGAMENWGAIFTFEYALLFDPAISTQADRQTIFAVLAHEMAHQWFGNLVTMAWWDDLWLNEGFASWMEGRMTERLHPEWNTALNAIDVRDHAMQQDSLSTTHPVVQHVETVEQASQAFDNITYAKGEAVIRMLEGYVGATGWRDGVRVYIKTHAYGNTVSDDLWAAVETAGGKPVTAIAHDFTLQPGVPLIRVGETVCTNGSTNTRLTQGEFSRDQPNKKPLRWRVPVIAQTLGSTNPVNTLIIGGSGQLQAPGCGPLIVNAGQSGYYRTLYPPGQLVALAANFATVAPIDQLGLLSDSFALGMAGLQPASIFLDFAKVTPLAADPKIWSRIAQDFVQIHFLYAGDSVRRKRFDSFASTRLAPVMEQVGWAPAPGEPVTVTNLRTQLIDALSELNDPATIDEARRRYAAMAKNPQAVPAALRKTILGVIARHADSATWDALRAQAKAERSPMIKDFLYQLLATSSDKKLARRALELALTDEPGVTNSAAMIARVARTYPDTAFDFAIANIDKINERLDTTSRARYFPRLASTSSDPAMIGKIEAYARANLAPGARRDADAAIAGVRDRVRIRTLRLPEIDAWLARYGS